MIILKFSVQKKNRWSSVGNVRELENMIGRAIVVGSGKKIGLRDLPLQSEGSGRGCRSGS